MAKRRSLADDLRDEDALGTAAADAAVWAVSTMNAVVTVHGVSRPELADRLGVSEERVDEILDGDGNVRVSTLARVLATCNVGIYMGITSL